jgi:hypothetical protein
VALNPNVPHFFKKRWDFDESPAYLKDIKTTSTPTCSSVLL